MASVKGHLHEPHTKLVVLITMTVLLTSLATPSEANSGARCSDGPVKAASMETWNSLDCSPDTDLEIVLPDGRRAVAPDPGWSVTGSATTVEGAAPVPDITIRRAEDGQVMLAIGEEGEAATLYGDTSLEVSADATAAVPPYQPTRSATTTHTTRAHPKWISTFKWRLKSGTSIPQATIAAGINAMTVGTGTCSNVANGATASYVGTTTSSATISSSNICLTTNLLNVIDVGPLPSTILAATCRYENSSEISYATVRFNSSKTWYSGSVTGCSGSKYDAQGVAAHEAGHVFGLNHVAASSLQVMKPASGTCEVSQRLLDPGDLAGMKSVYP